MLRLAVFRCGLKAIDQLFHLVLPARKLAGQIVRQKRVFIAEDFVLAARRAENVGARHGRENVREFYNWRCESCEIPIC